ncbi:ATP synthase delta subunit-domain-containing protein [Baffinella frigidus]|nr:ATP synthase delta subunit-domain-containing protein [Cryptophyta sp. CCMP2293]
MAGLMMRSMAARVAGRGVANMVCGAVGAGCGVFSAAVSPGCALTAAVAARWSQAVRTMSTKAETIRVPVAMFGLSGRYASALYIAATKANALEAVEKDFGALAAALKSDASFERFIKDPTLKRTVKQETMAKVTASSNETTQKMMAVLCEMGRLDELENVIRDYNSIMRGHRKEIGGPN